MAILRAAATANDTLDQTTDTLIAGMTVTPAAGDYLAFFTSEISTATTSDFQTTTFSIFVGGVQIDHSEREYADETSLDQDTTTMVVSCKVSPNGSQAVEVRYRITANVSPLTAQRRELNLFPISGTDYQQTALTDDTRASATFATLDSMTVTPIAGDYLLVFSTSGDGPASASLDFRVTVGGVAVDHSLRTTFQVPSIAPSEVPIYLAVSISPNGSQVVEIEWARVTGTGTITVHERTMNLIPTAAADIFQATGTVDDTDSTTTDKQVDDMLITNPGAADYLVIFSGTDFYGTIDNDVAETVYSIREGGVKVTDSDRMNEHEGSLDDADLICGTGGRVTVSAGNDLQIFWQNANTDTRTIRERTMVALREATAGITSERELDDTTSLADAGLWEHTSYLNVGEKSTEVIDAVQAIFAVGGFNVFLSDTINVVDALRYFYTLHQELSDTITLVDDPRYTFILHRLLADDINVVDEPRYTTFLHRLADDSIPILDAVFTELLLLFSREVADTAGVADDIRYTTFLHRLLDDSVPVVDEFFRSYVLHRFGDDSSALVDDIRYQYILHRLLDDTVGSLDEVFTEQIFVVLRQLAETISVLDELRTTYTLHRQFDETIPVQDDITFLIEGLLQALLSDTIAVVDEPRYFFTRHQELTDAVALVDDPRYTVFLHRLLDDSIGFVDDIFVQRVVIYLRELADTLGIADEIRYLAFLHRLLDESVSIADEPRYIFTRHQELDDSSALVDEPRYFFTRHQNLDDSIPLLDDIFVESVLILLREIADSIGFIDEIRYTYVLHRRFDDSIPLVDEVRYTAVLHRFGDDSITVLDNIFFQELEPLVQLSDAIGILEEPRYITILFRELDDGTIVVDEIQVPPTGVDGILIILERPF